MANFRRNNRFPHRRAAVTVAAAALVLAGLVAPRTALAAGPFPAGVWGNDISWPQCNGAYPSGFSFLVVGVNDGYPTTTNPCLGSEWARARTGPFPATVYINTDNPPSSRPRFAAGNAGPAGSCTQVSTCHMYNYGVAAAANAYATARQQGIVSPIWWLDVETGNWWMPWGTPSASDQALNAAVLQGNIDYLRSQAVTVGIYSTRYQFGQIAGSYSPGVPVWLADYDTSTPADDCHPWKGFGGGQVWMVQIGPGQFDTDYSCPSPNGYWLAASDGGVFTFGTAGFAGSAGGQRLNQPVVGMAATVDGGGYWLDASDGGIFAFGDAPFYGSMGGRPLAQPIVGMAATGTGHGYWLVASDGGIFAFGDAPFYGSMGGRPLVQPIVGMAATPTGHGYWLVASDGGIFAFGDAQFLGSAAGQQLNQPVVGMAAGSDGAGYWLVGRDGGIFAYGHLGFFGSAGSAHLSAPVVSVAATRSGQGYWITAADGTVVNYGDAQPEGGLTGQSLYRPIVGMAPSPVSQ